MKPECSRAVVYALIILLCVFGILCPVFSTAASETNEKLSIFVGILPVSYFVERIVGPNAEVKVLVSPGQDPHSFEPTPKLMGNLANAKLLFVTGFPFEKKLASKIKNNKGLEIVDLQKGIDLQPLDDEGHDHDGHKHGHAAGEMDPHTWLDPKLAKVQAQTIADALIKVDGANSQFYLDNLKQLHSELDAVHSELQEALSGLKGRKFYVFHPAYGYFASAYGLTQVAVQIGGKEPSAKQIARLIDHAKKDNVKVIFVQPQFPTKSAEVIAREIGGVVVHLDDLSPDYLNNLRTMARKIDDALNPGRAGK